MINKQTYRVGIFAEKVSMVFLICKFYRILKWRYKVHSGEIDIIAQKSRTIIFVEVKFRRTKVNIEELIYPKQVNRIKRAAEFFISKNPQLQNFNRRFDFIEVNRFFWPSHYYNFMS